MRKETKQSIYNTIDLYEDLIKSLQDILYDIDSGLYKTTELHVVKEYINTLYKNTPDIISEIDNRLTKTSKDN